MPEQLKKYLSFLLLTALLLPSVAEVVHNFHHLNDEHCTERQVVHFHQTEHHCSLCDYILTNASEPSELTPFQKIFYPTPLLFTYVKDFVSDSQLFHYSLRGPPFIA